MIRRSFDLSVFLIGILLKITMVGGNVCFGYDSLTSLVVKCYNKSNLLMQSLKGD